MLSILFENVIQVFNRISNVAVRSLYWFTAAVQFARQANFLLNLNDKTN